jgi:hypothetical protein
MNVTRALRALRLHPLLGLAAGFGIFAVAFELRFALDEALRELPFDGSKGVATRLVFPVA